MEPVTEEQLKNGHRTVLFVAGAIGASAPLYVLAAQFLAPATPPASDAVAVLAYALLALYAAGLQVAVPALRRAILTAEPPAASPAGGHPAAIQKLTTAALVTLGACELPMLVALIAHFLLDLGMRFYFVCLASVLLVAFHTPRYAQWKEWYRLLPPAS